MKYKIIVKIITALFCILMLCISIFVEVIPYYAFVLPDITLHPKFDNYDYYIVLKREELSDGDISYVLVLGNEKFYFDSSKSKILGIAGYSSINSSMETWNDFYEIDNVSCILGETSFYITSICFSNAPVYTDSTCTEIACNIVGGDENEEYDSNLGYLQNVRENKVYDAVPLGEVVNDKFHARWYFDNVTTTGIDLSSGNYSIRYYQERWLVKGYDVENDVVEKSDRYLVGEYSADADYIETYSEDIDAILELLGYEKPSFFDLLFHKFVNTHHYFQIVNNDTNEVGGYVHVYYTDENDKFGVEYIGETLDENNELDEDGYREEIEDNSITSDDVEEGFEELENNEDRTIEEWFEDLFDKNDSSLDGFDGIDVFLSNIEFYSSSVEDFSFVVASFVNLLPGWFSGLIVFSVCLMFLLILIKSLRG